MLTAIVFFDVVLTIHILAVVLAFGVVFAYPLLDTQLKRAHPDDLPALHRLHLTLARGLITPAMTVVLLAGLYLALDRYSLGDPWISATFAILIVLFALVGAVLTPLDKRLLEIALRDQRAGTGPSDDYRAAEGRAALFGSIALLLVIVSIFLMTAKPGA